jgi:hypothetical protein
VTGELSQEVREARVVAGDQFRQRGLVAGLRAHDEDPLIDQVKFVAHAGTADKAELPEPHRHKSGCGGAGKVQEGRQEH